MIKKAIFYWLLLFWVSRAVYAQEVQSYSVADFNLQGPVKECVVITKYGKEVYTFNRAGQLTSAATIFSKGDSETTYYKYAYGVLLERRVENYVNGALDKKTSLANFYTYDTLSRFSVKEKIINYNREFIAQFNYSYDSIGQLSAVLRTNTQGRFLTEISHKWDSLKTKKTSYFMMDSLVIREIDSVFNSKPKWLKTVCEKAYMGRELKRTFQYNFNENGHKIMDKEVAYQATDTINSVVYTLKNIYKLNKEGYPIEIKIEKENTTQYKKNIYQWDGSPFRNWIKKITTPDNTYATRRIVYFEPELGPK